MGGWCQKDVRLQGESGYGAKAGKSAAPGGGMNVEGIDQVDQAGLIGGGEWNAHEMHEMARNGTKKGDFIDLVYLIVGGEKNVAWTGWEASIEAALMTRTTPNYAKRKDDKN